MKIGFIGLGNMGAPMAANLAAENYEVRGYDTARPHIADILMVETLVDVVDDADIVVTMLPNAKILNVVAKEIIPIMKAGSVFVDCSTIDVETARNVASQAMSEGILALDAPVSGGVIGAGDGTLTFMVGGSLPAFVKAKEIFKTMGSKAVHCGDSGAGQAAKICNNMILGITMLATCEAFTLADKLHLDRQKLFDVVAGSSGNSWSMSTYCPAPGVGPKSPADNNYRPGFSAELMLKDLCLSQDAAKTVDAATPLGKMATQIYEKFVELEDGKGKDFSAILPYLEKIGQDIL